MSLTKNRVWVKFFSFAIVFAFVVSSALMTVSSEPLTQNIIPSTGQSMPSYVPGTEWVKDGVVLDVGPVGEEKHVTTPCVLLLPDGTYAIWYQALGNDGHQRIMKAVSSDGLSWTRIGIALDYGEQYAESGVMFPFVMIDDGGMYHMWYSGYSYKWRAILHADSPDGITWTKHGPELFYGSSFDLDGVASPRVHFDGTQWHMWYSGVLWYPDRDTVCHAHKTLLSDPWVKDGTVLYNDGEYDNPIAWSPWVVPVENGYDLFYGGRSPAQYPGRICHAHSADGLEWTKTGIAVDQTLPGESYMTDFPSVIYENGEYRMWYVGYDGINSRIYHASAASPQASSVDLSVASEDIALSDSAPTTGDTVTITAIVQGDQSEESGWVKHGIILDADYPGEDLRLANPCVLSLQNGTYIMYYTAKSNDGASTSLYWRIYRAFSYDGISWQRQGIVLDYGGAYAGNAVYNPCVWIAPDGTYHLWYAGQNYESGNRARILHATSPDGFNFVYDGLDINFGSSIEPAGVGYPFVMSSDTGFRMWYTGIAWSPLKNWINHAHKTNLSDAWVRDGTVLPNTGQYDNPLANQAWVLASDGCYEMFYTGFDSAGVFRILKATSVDGTIWTKEGIVIEPSLPGESAGIMGCSVVKEGGTYKMWYGGWDGAKMRIFYAEKTPGYTALDATCTVSFYLDSEDPVNLIGSIENVLVPGDGETSVSIDWTAVAGEHEIIAVVSDVNPPDSDLSDNIAVKPVSVSEPESLGAVDLFISADDISYFPDTPEAGSSLNINATVHGDTSISSEWNRQLILDLGGTGEDLYIYNPCVVQESDGTYVMWYTGDGNDGLTYRQRTFRAVSSDGINWTRTGMVMDYGGAYQEYGIQYPFVMKDSNGFYQMWYAGIGYSGGYRAYIHHATSTDGITWQKLGLDLNYGSAADPDGVSTPHVYYDGSQWHMWYGGVDWGTPNAGRICHAHKAQLTDPWIKDGVMLNNDGPYDYSVASTPNIHVTSEGYEMYYFGYHPSYGPGRILHATSPDGLTWTKTGIILEPQAPLETVYVGSPHVQHVGDNIKMWYAGCDGSHWRIFYAEKTPGHVGQNATCTVSFYMDTVDPINIIGSVENVFVPADDQTAVSMEWIPVAGEHEIVVMISNVIPQDIDETNNIASLSVTVEASGEVDLSTTPDDISVPQDAVTGGSYTLSATVHNLGDGQGVWEKQGVVLSPGSSAQYPYVIKDGSIYKMWYTGYGSTYDIYYATSPDRLTWTSYGKVLTHPTGTTYAAAPSVIKEADGTFKMWYSCQNYNWNSEIYYATSTDGVSWTQLGKVLPIGPAGSFDAVYACQGYIFKDAGMYKMYYKAYDSELISRFGFATSTDGISWTKYGAVMNTPVGYAAMECPFVLPNVDGSYDMWFSTGKILKTHSADGIAWEPAAVALDVTPGGQDSRALYTQCVLFDAGNSYMYYSGDSGSTSYIFLAEMVPAGQDATCTVSFYLDSQDPTGLIGSVENVFVPAGGEAQVSMNWTAVAGDHEIIVIVSDVDPADSDLSNNVASAFITVCSPAVAALEVTKVRLSGPEEGFTHTYYEWELLITVTNTGNSDAVDVMVMDVLPAELGLLEMTPSAGNAIMLEQGTRSALPTNEIWPQQSTHIYWTVGELEAGQSETLYLKVCTRQNPAGKQEFTSPGTYIINVGAYATGWDPGTGEFLTSAPAPAITVLITEQEPVIGLPPQPQPINWNTVCVIAKPVNRYS